MLKGESNKTPVLSHLLDIIFILFRLVLSDRSCPCWSKSLIKRLCPLPPPGHNIYIIQAGPPFPILSVLKGESDTKNTCPLPPVGYNIFVIQAGPLGQILSVLKGESDITSVLSHLPQLTETADLKVVTIVNIFYCSSWLKIKIKMHLIFSGFCFIFQNGVLDYLDSALASSPYGRLLLDHFISRDQVG